MKKERYDLLRANGYVFSSERQLIRALEELAEDAGERAKHGDMLGALWSVGYRAPLMCAASGCDVELVNRHILNAENEAKYPWMDAVTCNEDEVRATSHDLLAEIDTIEDLRSLELIVRREIAKYLDFDKLVRRLGHSTRMTLATLRMLGVVSQAALRQALEIVHKEWRLSNREFSVESAEQSIDRFVNDADNPDSDKFAALYVDLYNRTNLGLIGVEHLERIALTFKGLLGSDDTVGDHANLVALITQITQVINTFMQDQKDEDTI